jgi:SM-20-related protein
MNFFSEDQWLTWIDQLAEQDYVVIDQFVDESHFSSLRQFFLDRLQDDHFSKAGIGAKADYTIEPDIRGDFVYWLQKDRDLQVRITYDLMDELLMVLNRYCFLSLSDYEFHLAYYPPGSFYHRHLDQFRERSNRMITIVLYLNQYWQQGDGGELKIYPQNGKYKLIAPIPARAIIFRSDALEHEVLTTQVGRYSFTGWFLYRQEGLKFL